MTDKKFKWVGDPMDNQIKAARKAWNKPMFALFHEMGTGKTYTAIHLAKFRYLAGQITHLLVVCPSTI